jgi:hypothetical protein
VNVDLLTLLADQICRRMTRDLRPAPEPGTPQTCSVGAIYYEPTSVKPFAAGILLKEVEKAGADARKQSVRPISLYSMEERGVVRLDVSSPIITAHHQPEAVCASV